MFLSILQRKLKSTEYFVQVTKTLTVKKSVEQQQKKKKSVQSCWNEHFGGIKLKTWKQTKLYKTNCTFFHFK